MQRQFTRFAVVAVQALLAVSVPTTEARADRVGKWSVLEVTGTRPAARKHHSMVYDPVNNRVIMYGGENPDVLGDLWALHLDGTPSWEQITATGNAPPAVHGHSAAYDATNGRMLLLGGRIDDGVTVSSFPDGVRSLTWSGSSYTWNLLFNFPTRKFLVCAPNPASCKDAYHRRTHAAVACLADGLYQMGGQLAPGMVSAQDLWNYSFDSPRLNYLSGTLFAFNPLCDECQDPVFPNFRHYHSMIADGHGRLVVFGGVYEETPLSNTFVYSPSAGWTFLGNVPTASHNFSREFHTAVFDPIGDRMVVVGGYIRDSFNTTITGAVTSLPLPSSLPQYSHPDGENNTWVLHETCGTTPGNMAEHAAVYDSQGDRIIVFGGVSDVSGTLRNNDVWVLDFTDDTPPAAVTLSPAQVGRYSSTISWTAPGDDDNLGTACEYDLRRSSDVITEENFYSATRIGADMPSIAGSPECGTTGPNTPCSWYYYALKTIDDAGNVSPMSNALAIQQTCSGNSYACTGGGLLASENPAGVEYSIRGTNLATGSTTLFVGVPGERQGEAMEMTISDLTGRRVRTLVNQAAKAGDLEVVWDHRNDGGASVAGGVYFARLRIGQETRTHRIVILHGR